MSDNTLQGGNDLIRDLARQGGNAKTQVIQLDLGGASANGEVLITAGQQVMAVSVPVVLVSNQPAISVADSANPYRGTSSYASGISGAVTIAAGARVLGVSASSMSGGTITIFGGMDIIITPGSGFNDDYNGFVGPGDIVFTNTDSFYVVVNQ